MGPVSRWSFPIYLGSTYVTVRALSSCLNSYNRSVMITCVIAPYMLAFNQDDFPSNLNILDIILNILFFIDIFVNFFSA